MSIDPQVKYRDERLPRYTSYPTAPHFSPDVSALQYGDWLASLGPEASSSLYLLMYRSAGPCVGTAAATPP